MHNDSHLSIYINYLYILLFVIRIFYAVNFARKKNAKTKTMRERARRDNEECIINITTIVIVDAIIMHARPHSLCFFFFILIRCQTSIGVSVSQCEQQRAKPTNNNHHHASFVHNYDKIPLSRFEFVCMWVVDVWIRIRILLLKLIIMFMSDACKNYAWAVNLFARY